MIWGCLEEFVRFCRVNLLRFLDNRTFCLFWTIWKVDVIQKLRVVARSFIFFLFFFIGFEKLVYS